MLPNTQTSLRETTPPLTSFTYTIYTPYTPHMNTIYVQPPYSISNKQIISPFAIPPTHPPTRTLHEQTPRAPTSLRYTVTVCTPTATLAAPPRPNRRARPRPGRCTSPFPPRTALRGTSVGPELRSVGVFSAAAYFEFVRPFLVGAMVDGEVLAGVNGPCFEFFLG
jgi:hypothetical protein